ncbi:hypothetical protein Nepgr_005825 [Nepenthes gracilis]|uniref:Uncharacterized protein n=1 Tax=Nepenthes gracilis TaxID=150966 RepID=A0AAD3S424_NEPGR|nr:hypothetical protein Nepgr_005825 [Nepenthes gracilis]
MIAGQDEDVEIVDWDSLPLHFANQEKPMTGGVPHENDSCSAALCRLNLRSSPPPPTPQLVKTTQVVLTMVK